MRVLLILMVLSFCSKTRAQIQVKNTSLTNPDLDILYIGVDNCLEVSGIYELPTIDVISSGNQQIIRSDIDNSFIVRVRNPGFDTLSISYNGKILVRRIFRIRNISDPVLQLGSVKGTTASVTQILADKAIRIKLPDCHYNLVAQIISFQIGFSIKGSDIYREFGPESGFELTEAQLCQIAELLPGDQIYITDVKVRFNDAAMRTMVAPQITIR